MIIALGDQLPHLIQRVLAATRHMLGDIGDLRPDDQAVFIAQIIKFLGVLIVGQADGVGPDLPDKSHILPVLFDRQRTAQPGPILMAADAPQRITASVQDKALFRIKSDGAHAETGADFIPRRQGSPGFIQERIVHAVPQMGRVQREHRLRVAVLGGSFLCFARYSKGDRQIAILPGFHRNFGHIAF